MKSIFHCEKCGQNKLDISHHNHCDDVDLESTCKNCGSMNYPSLYELIEHIEKLESGEKID